MIWCSYATRRSHMSTTITLGRPRSVGRIARREPRASARRLGSGGAHLAEQAYAAELVHAERARASERRLAGEAPAREQRAVRALRALRDATARRGFSAGGPAQADTLPAAAGPARADTVPAGAPEPSSSAERRRWLALAVLCLGQLMMVLDATIVNVALPSIQHDLHFTQSNLTWVIDGYLITFGGFLLLAGRVGDLIGRKKVFLTGLVMFVAASVLCGVGASQGMLIVARLLQGVGGAVASSVILAII